MQKKSTTKLVLIGCFIALTLAISALPARAQAPSTYWISTEDTDWFNCDNWSNGCPDNTKDTYINNGFKSQITSDEGTARSLTLGLNLGESGELQVDSVHGSLVVAQGSGESINYGDVYVGNLGNGVLNITNGASVSCGSAYIAASSSGQLATTGAVTVGGTGSTLALSYINAHGTAQLFVGGTSAGAGGNGLLRVSDGGTVTIFNDSNVTGVFVKASGTVTGNGTITIQVLGTGYPVMRVEGTLTPTGTLTINGILYLVSTATTECNVTPQGADKVEINQYANLDGRLSVTMTGDFSSAPTQYILLHAGGGLNNTTFASVSIKYPTGHGWHPTITYDNNGYVYLNRIFDLHP